MCILIVTLLVIFLAGLIYMMVSKERQDKKIKDEPVDKTHS
jgi:hypothetical protein